MLSRSQLRCFVSVWLIALTLGSFLPQETKQAIGTESGLITYGEPSMQHRAWHFAMYGCAALVAGAIADSKRSLWLYAGGLVFLGLAIESLQAVVFGSVLEWWDVRDNAYAAVALTYLGHMKRVRKLLRKFDDL